MKKIGFPPINFRAKTMKKNELSPTILSAWPAWPAGGDRGDPDAPDVHALVVLPAADELRRHEPEVHSGATQKGGEGSSSLAEIGYPPCRHASIPYSRGLPREDRRPDTDISVKGAHFYPS